MVPPSTDAAVAAAVRRVRRAAAAGAAAACAADAGHVSATWGARDTPPKMVALFMIETSSRRLAADIQHELVGPY